MVGYKELVQSLEETVLMLTGSDHSGFIADVRTWLTGVSTGSMKGLTEV